MDSAFYRHVNVFYQPSAPSGSDAFLPSGSQVSGGLKVLESSASSQLDKDVDEFTAPLFQRYDAA